MTFDVVTIFPAMFERPLALGVIGRAIERGVLDLKVRDLRDFTSDRHRIVDDVPFGGGPGMVLKADPLFRALDAIEADRGRPLTVVLTSPRAPRSAVWRPGQWTSSLPSRNENEASLDAVQNWYFPALGMLIQPR